MELLEFLVARNAEDQAAAQVAREAGPLVYELRYLLTNGWHPADADHVSRWSPERVVAECAAKQRILNHLNLVLHGPSDSPRYDYAELQMREMVQPYADHPDFQPEWTFPAR